MRTTFESHQHEIAAAGIHAGNIGREVAQDHIKAFKADIDAMVAQYLDSNPERFTDEERQAIGANAYHFAIKELKLALNL